MKVQFFVLAAVAAALVPGACASGLRAVAPASSTLADSLAASGAALAGSLGELGVPLLNICPPGQTFFGCKPCLNRCGLPAGMTICSMVCSPGCSCPAGSWTRSSDSKCYTTMKC